MGKKDLLKKTMPRERSLDEFIAGNATALSSIMSADKTEYQYLMLDQIIANPYNDYSEYDSKEDIAGLADDIKRVGLLHNIVVSYRADGTYMLLSGEKRLKAYRLLREQDPSNPKWATIYSAVLKGLDVTDEMIVLDAANLQARGGGSNNEVQYRKACARFVKNLKDKYSITDDEAMRLAADTAQASQRSLRRNWDIETKLDAQLLDMVDSKAMEKALGEKLAHQTPSVQEHVRQTIETITEKGTARDAKTYMDELDNALKKGKPVKSVAPPVFAEETMSALPFVDVVTSLQGSCLKIERAVAKLEKQYKMVRVADRAVENGTKIEERLMGIYKRIGDVLDGISNSKT